MLHRNDELIAHNVKTEGNVAATFHIEPNHNPKAGEPSRAWFALTKAGGELIPLSRCNCQLRVINNNQTIAQPALKAISAEQYQGIPGAEITFPKAGLYKLEISGTPKNGDFSEFKLDYDVTVQAGQAAPNPLVQPAPATAPTNQIGWLVPIGITAIVLVALSWFVKRTFKK